MKPLTQAHNLPAALPQLNAEPSGSAQQDVKKDGDNPLKNTDIPAIHTYSGNDSLNKTSHILTLCTPPKTLTEADFEAIALLEPTMAKQRYLAILQNPDLDASLRLKAYVHIQDPSIDLGELSPHLQALGEISLGNLKTRDIIPSSDLTQVYEPYWRYNEKGLRDYAKQILKQISPYIIQASDIDQNTLFVSHEGENISVRKVNEFGRVLPLLHLKEVLKQTHATHLAVPRIFLLPKDPGTISFSFGLPYHEEESGAFHCSAGDNSLYIESQSFAIYQECIEGNGYAGNTDFMHYGHYDLNRIQIIRSKKDSKNYLIDTKDSKNFFIPTLNPFDDIAHTYWHYKIGRYLPQDQDSFKPWQRKQRMIMILEKCFNYGLHQDKIAIHLGPLPDRMLEDTPVEAYSGIFDDNSESRPYFENPEANAARYIELKKLDVLQSLMLKHPELNLNSVSLPSRFGWLPINIERLCQELEPEHPQFSALIKERSQR